MEKLIEKVENLKTALDEEQVVIDLKKLNSEIKTDEELNKLLTEYHNSPSETLRNNLIQNSKIRKYKEKETELNILILEINSNLKQITKKDKCSL